MEVYINTQIQIHEGMFLPLINCASLAFYVHAGFVLG